MLAFLKAIFFNPKMAAVLASLHIGRPDLADDLIDICMRESATIQTKAEMKRKAVYEGIVSLRGFWPMFWMSKGNPCMKTAVRWSICCIKGWMKISVPSWVTLPHAPMENRSPKASVVRICEKSRIN